MVGFMRLAWECFERLNTYIFLCEPFLVQLLRPGVVNGVKYSTSIPSCAYHSLCTAGGAQRV